MVSRRLVMVPRAIEFNYGDTYNQWLKDNEQNIINGSIKITKTHYTGSRQQGTSILVEYTEGV
ncbi:hypothetical protein DIGNKC_182 [Bacillus phage DIGNKC]|uniref:hypothetical protein n=1 Tax=Bacillus phage DIGNKC TaxID=1805948 RepID=UPI0007A77443|nr:hypothetical protein BI007_gp192 [Bacillus phage DIGNKC]AMW62855.1 hypothetical protein DIGNKC_182 [Bacillus phage DIGNKC]